MNRLFRIAALCAALFSFAVAPDRADAAGTVPLALSVQTDQSGNIASGCLLYFYQAGTVATPQNAYQDFGLTQVLPNPITCDQSGRLGMFWLADGLIHIRLTDSTGIVLVDTTMQTLGPSSGGGGGGGTVDPTTILSTGDEKIRYGTGTLTGFVRENGLTIGNSTSGATERANADTQALFIYLYNTDPNLVVSGGRTSNALNDYNASKTIALPDMRGRINAFLDDMGNTTAGRLASPYFSAPTTLGAAGGLQDMPGLAATNIPPITSTGSFSGNATPTGVNIPGNNGGITTAPTVSTGTFIVPVSSSWAAISAANLPVTGSASVTSTGTTSAPFSILPPIMLRTQYMKL